jgi:hypothetical protein
MPDRFHTHIEIAERLRVFAATASEPRKQRLLRLAEMYELEPQLIHGSRRAIDDSRALLARVERQIA